MTATRPPDLAQDATTDCSVVASLCAIVAYDRRAGRRAASRSRLRSRTRSRTRPRPRPLFKGLYPQDPVTRHPVLSHSGKYVARLYFNGCHRRVVIDDRLPASHPTTASTLHVLDRSNPALLWPCLVEKAYLKIRGGYDFPGSNSGTDLWVLTGWVPEQIFLHDEACDENSLDGLWVRVYGAWREGDVLVTIGTGELTARVEREVGLVGSHDYAVLEMRVRDGRRELLVKNPWASGVSWRGAAETSQLDTQMGSMHLTDEEEGKEEGEDGSAMPGTFWTTAEEVFLHFEHMYLNWRPSLFAHRVDRHFCWDLSTSGNGGNPAIVAANPQYTLTTGATAGPVWLLLSRHFATEDGGKSQKPGFVGVYVFGGTAGKRVLLSDKAWRHGPLVDSPNSLLRLTAQASTSYTVVPVAHDMPARTYHYSLTALSSAAPVTLEPAASRYPYCSRFDAAWTVSTAGGNTESPRYLCNPQFAVQVADRSQPCTMAIFL
ncbi:cysteine protease, partial [Ascosphaera acerosa]